MVKEKEKNEISDLKQIFKRQRKVGVGGCKTERERKLNTGTLRLLFINFPLTCFT